MLAVGETEIKLALNLPSRIETTKTVKLFLFDYKHDKIIYIVWKINLTKEIEKMDCISNA